MVTSAQIISYALEHRDVSKWPNYTTVAEKLGVTKNAISLWSLGKHAPRYEYVVMLVEMLGFNFSELYNQLETQNAK